MKNFPFSLGSAFAFVTALGTPLLAQPNFSPSQQQLIRSLPPNPFGQPFKSPFENRYPEPLEPKESPILDFSAVEQANKCTSPGGYEGRWFSFEKDGKLNVICFNQDEQSTLILQNAQKKKEQSGTQ